MTLLLALVLGAHLGPGAPQPAPPAAAAPGDPALEALRERRTRLHALADRIARGESVDVAELAGVEPAAGDRAALEAAEERVDALRRRWEEARAREPEPAPQAEAAAPPAPAPPAPAGPPYGPPPPLFRFPPGADLERVGEALLQLGRHHEALRAYEVRAAALGDQAPSWLLFRLARLRERTGDLDGARQVYDRLRAAGANEPWAAQAELALRVLDVKQELRR
jgi:tetratricopeptide (TPR) repeat protein